MVMGRVRPNLRLVQAASPIGKPHEVTFPSARYTKGRPHLKNILWFQAINAAFSIALLLDRLAAA